MTVSGRRRQPAVFSRVCTGGADFAPQKRTHREGSGQILRTGRCGDFRACGAACRKSRYRPAAACFWRGSALYRRKRDLFAQKITPSSHFVKKVLGCRETTVSPTSRNGPQAVPKSSESSYTETFSLLKYKNRDTCSRFL